METILKEAFEGQIEELKAQASKTLKAQFNYVIHKYGPTMMGNGSIFNSKEYRLANLVRSISDAVDGKNPWDRSTYELNLNLVDDVAENHAKESVEQWYHKIINKLENLDNISIARINNACGFIIKGTREGKNVEINQKMIINCRTATGSIFNQFPSRIYLNGKSISEKKYKELSFKS